MLTKSIHKVVLLCSFRKKKYSMYIHNIKGSSICCIKKFALFESEVSPTLTWFFGKKENDCTTFKYSRFIQCTTDKLFFISADTDKARYTQFSYRPIPIKYRYDIFHIGRYR